jgi:hypothetical protein
MHLNYRFPLLDFTLFIVRLHFIHTIPFPLHLIKRKFIHILNIFHILIKQLKEIKMKNNTDLIAYGSYDVNIGRFLCLTYTVITVFRLFSLNCKLLLCTISYWLDSDVFYNRNDLSCLLIADPY